MTESAKQDTSAKRDNTAGSAQAANAESAATADADSAADAQSASSGTPAAAAATPDPAAASAGAGDTADGDKPDLDDMKAKFREALDRKRQVHAERQGKGAHDSGKVSGAHGPAASRRNFRRKSG